MPGIEGKAHSMVDIEAGGSTHAEGTTYLRGVKPDDGPFNGPHILFVGPGVGDSAPNENMEGVVGEASKAATGVVGIGRTGVAGYADLVTRDPNQINREVVTRAGVIGVGASASATGVGGTPGVFGIGSPGVRGDGDEVGIAGTGVNVGGVGVKGTADIGVGVYGTGLTGVQGEAPFNPTDRVVGVSGLSNSPNGVGVWGYSSEGLAGEFQTGRGPQIRLVPHGSGATYFGKGWTPTIVDVDGRSDAPPLPLPKNAQVGEIACLVLPLPHASDEPERQRATLWLCVGFDGPDSPALWQQILTGPEYPGTV